MDKQVKRIHSSLFTHRILILSLFILMAGIFFIMIAISKQIVDRQEAYTSQTFAQIRLQRQYNQPQNINNISPGYFDDWQEPTDLTTIITTSPIPTVIVASPIPRNTPAPNIPPCYQIIFQTAGWQRCSWAQRNQCVPCPDGRESCYRNQFNKYKVYFQCQNKQWHYTYCLPNDKGTIRMESCYQDMGNQCGCSPL